MKKIMRIAGLVLVMAAALMLAAGCGSSGGSGGSGGEPVQGAEQWAGTWDLVSIITEGQEDAAGKLGEEVVMTLDEKGGGTYEDVIQEFTEEITWEETDGGIHVIFSEAKDEYIIMDASMQDGKLYLDMDSGEEGEHDPENFYVFEKR